MDRYEVLRPGRQLAIQAFQAADRIDPGQVQAAEGRTLHAGSKQKCLATPTGSGISATHETVHGDGVDEPPAICPEDLSHDSQGALCQHFLVERLTLTSRAGDLRFPVIRLDVPVTANRRDDTEVRELPVD